MQEAQNNAVDMAVVAEMKGIFHKAAAKSIEAGKKSTDHAVFETSGLDFDDGTMNQLLTFINITVPDMSTETLKPYRAAADLAQGQVIMELKSAPKATGRLRKARSASATTKAPANKKVIKGPSGPTRSERIMVDGVTHKLPEKDKRADMVPRPVNFFLEADSEATRRSPHQVDPSRSQGYAPVMPNINLLDTTGNPYPETADDTVKTSLRFLPMVTISHHAWKAYKKYADSGQMVKASDNDFIAEVLNGSAIGEAATVRSCIQHTLRDCALYGLTQPYKSGRTWFFSAT